MTSKLNILEKYSTDLKIKIMHKENFSHVEIFDSNKNTLGGISRITKEEFGLSNSNGITILRSREISKLYKFEYHLEEKNGNLLGIGKTKGFFNINFLLEKDGKVILHTERSGSHFEIKNTSEKIVGYIESGPLDQGKFFNLKIRDQDYDRLELLGIFLFSYHKFFGRDEFNYPGRYGN